MMTNEELNKMLNEMDPEERELALAADDAYDRWYACKLRKKYGVTVECNPGGDRTKVAIDGVVMDQAQFAAWLLSKRLAEMSQRCVDAAYGRSDDPELPTDMDIDYEDLGCDSIGDDRAVLNYLRDTYDHYLAGGVKPSLHWEDGYVSVTNIQWGRKR